MPHVLVETSDTAAAVDLAGRIDVLRNRTRHRRDPLVE
jgi:hypothetical protein